MNYFNKIKNIIENKEINDRVRYLESNKETVKTYYEIGKLLIEAQGGEKRAKYGDNLIKEWSLKLSKEYGNNYSYRNLNYMRKFYMYFKKVNTVCSQSNLSWSHYKYLLKFDNENERNYYVNRCIKNNLSVRGLINEIKSDSFNRLSYADKENIKLIVEDNKKLRINDMFHDPIIININKEEKLSEKVLKKYILNELEHIFLELGTGFTFVGSEYKLTYENKNYYVDLMLFNTELNRYFACELKLNDSTVKDVAQTKLYMMLTDKILKRSFHKSTVGILISRKNNNIIFEYVSDPNLFLTTYKINNNSKVGS